MSLKDKIKFYGIKKIPCKVSSSELKIGTKIESEHTSDRKIARAIAIAHLCKESPVYYTKGLVPMEAKLSQINSAKSRFGNKLKGGK
jgi:hypothetical protein